MTAAPRVSTRLAALVLLVGLALSGAVLALGPQEATTAQRPGAGLAEGAQSTRVAETLPSLPGGQTVPAVVVFSRPGSTLTEADEAVAADTGRALAPSAVDGEVVPAEVSPDRRAAIVVVPLPGGDDDRTNAAVARIRDQVRQDLPEGLRVEVTGAAGFGADLSAVFDGANTTLLLVTVAVVATLLLLTYRSPLLWLVPLAVVGLADRVAVATVGSLAPRLDIDVDPSANGILSVLVFGAGTDYALLLIARYRDELRLEEDRGVAMGRALRGAAPAVLASAGTVVVSLLTLLLATLTSNRGLGFAGAVAIAVAMVSSLTLLPAVLVLCGRALFWPFVPRPGDAPPRHGVWARVGALVTRRPAVVVAGGLAVLAVLALGLGGVRIGLSETERLQARPEAVRGQETLARAFPAGTSEPVTVLTRTRAVDEVVATAKDVPGVASAKPQLRGKEFGTVAVVLTGAPGSAESDRQVRALRAALTGVPGADAAVGGSVAESLDTRDATRDDERLVIPLVLAIVLVILVLLLRSLLAPVLLVLTVVATYGAALGGAWLAFDHLYGYPALDVTVPLLSFLFLVALGVDYNIFLVTRAREEAAGIGTRRGMVTALAATGGVITSAGILLAAVFAVLGVLPLITLTQIGVVVGIGVLLDTLLVRTVLVPALAELLGERFWWPGHVLRREATEDPEAAPLP